MNHSAMSLNGSWSMGYSDSAYCSNENPWNCKELNLEKESSIISDAVPGYWEDMTEKFTCAHFFRNLKINPQYGLQQYPISGVAPDMALPNIYGNFFYRRTFLCNDVKKDAVLHFDGVQNTVSVWINDTFIGSHIGYCTPFDIKIPDNLLCDGENTIVLSVSNFTMKGYGNYPVSGLTNRAANEFTGGITGNVELRVYNCPLRDVVLKVSDDTKRVDVSLVGDFSKNSVYTVCDNGKVIKQGEVFGDFSFDTENLEKWSPENPKLYTLLVRCGNGTIERKFGVRRLTPDGPHFKFNGIPYYLRGVCEHCYFPDTVHPNHDISFYRSIIKQFKKLGFNFIRFHTYIPEEEYMQAADELGMLLHVESPNNTTIGEWQEIINFCRRHTSVVIYCCGNELQIDDDYGLHLSRCGDIVHRDTDSLFSPLSALRGLEYSFSEIDKEHLISTPFTHNPKRFEETDAFADMYSSYCLGVHSYFSLDCNPEKVDANSIVYNNKPRVSHEICIDGTYTDLSLMDRYKDTRIGNTEMFSSIQAHLERKGLLKNAPLYFKNSSEWQRRIRKYCFESVRRSNNIAGYDFLGPIDTHWHTFGYDVGMMNEFYELKPGETIRNVRMYNSETVLLTDLAKKTNFYCDDTLSCNIFCSCYNKDSLENAELDIRLMADGKVIQRQRNIIDRIENGKVSLIHHLEIQLPTVDVPKEMTLYATLDGNSVFAENKWELYLFPKSTYDETGKITVSHGMTQNELICALKDGKDVLILGSKPFTSLPASFRISLAGRCSGNLATVINDHPLLHNIPHDGFCSWQFADMLEDSETVCLESDKIPFNPIIEVVSTHKYVIKKSALFEFSAFNGRCVVCSLSFKDNDPMANFLKSNILSYMASDDFVPKDNLSEEQLKSLICTRVVDAAGNTNVAFNPNDKTAIRKK